MSAEWKTLGEVMAYFRDLRREYDKKGGLPPRCVVISAADEARLEGLDLSQMAPADAANLLRYGARGTFLQILGFPAVFAGGAGASFFSPDAPPTPSSVKRMDV